MREIQILSLGIFKSEGEVLMSGPFLQISSINHLQFLVFALLHNLNSCTHADTSRWMIMVIWIVSPGFIVPVLGLMMNRLAVDALNYG